MTTKALLPFFALTFALTWGIAALLILFHDPIVALTGELGPSHPLYILAVYAPGIVGVGMVWRYYGWRGLGSFFRRLTLWRMPWPWWLYLLLGIPVVAYLSAALAGNLADPFPFAPWYGVLPALGLALILGPIEEFGWRGVALPLMQRRMAPLWAGLLLGVVWATWHIPAFLLSGAPHGAWSFLPFFGGVVAISVILTPMFNSARGSLLIAYLYHLQMMNPIWPDAQPWDNLLFAIVAVAVVLLNRRTMLQKGAGITEILMPGESPSTEPEAAPPPTSAPSPTQPLPPSA